MKSVIVTIHSIIYSQTKSFHIRVKIVKIVIQLNLFLYWFYFHRLSLARLTSRNVMGKHRGMSLLVTAPQM